MQSFLVALGTLTTIPVRFARLLPDAVVARSRYWYPLVGLLLAGLMGCWTWLVGLYHAPLLGAFLIVAAWVGITGALHVDGFCDLCDGLFGGKTPERRLEIMKDPHLGTFGLVGGILLLLGKFASVAEILKSRIAWEAKWEVGAAILLARCLVLSVAARARYPRPEGTGKASVEATGWWESLLAVVFALVVMAALPYGESAGIANFAFRAVVVILPVLGMVMMLRLLCERRLGGITGDCLGAAIETAELTYLVSAALLAARSV
jgi:adenosylcobinamide-GDP ribazoletransferase